MVPPGGGHRRRGLAGICWKIKNLHDQLTFTAQNEATLKQELLILAAQLETKQGVLQKHVETETALKEQMNEMAESLNACQIQIAEYQKAELTHSKRVEELEGLAQALRDDCQTKCNAEGELRGSIENLQQLLAKKDAEASQAICQVCFQLLLALSQIRM